MLCNDINIRDPFILKENGRFYMYGTRADNFGQLTGGFDVYLSDDLVNWSDPHECFDSVAHSLNQCVNWAPEVHRYNGKYYMFATFTRNDTGLRGTFILVSESPYGPFVPNGKKCVTPDDWECLDGTLYIDKKGKPYIVFCHEHTQIIDGTICYLPLSDDLTEAVGDPVTVFTASSCPFVGKTNNGHYVTDGPFMYRSKTDELIMIWSSFTKDGDYAEFAVKFDDGEIGTAFSHLPPIVTSDAGHGMIFDFDGKLYLTVHTPNTSGCEHPCFIEIIDKGDSLCVV